MSRLRRAGRLKTVPGRAHRRLEAAKLIREGEPSAVLVRDTEGSRIVGNLMPTRAALAESLGIAPERFLPEVHDILEGRSRRGAGIKRKDGIYGETEIPLAEVKRRLPVLTYYSSDGGPYLTAGVWVVRDPVHGVNASYHRLMMSGPTRGTVRVVENRGLDTALKHSGGKLDAAICIGAPMHVLFAASLSPDWGVSEMDLAARFGRLELIGCKTVGLEVPAACETVIEGRFTGSYDKEGPFVDITGTIDGVREQPVFEITRVAGRKDPIHYTIVPGLSDHRVLMGVPKELDIYREVSRVCRCVDVRITPGGASWLHAVVKIVKRSPADPRRALEAAFRGHKSLKHCVVVDDDIDIDDPSQVEWAVATRFQASRGLLVLNDRPSSSLDPSARHEPGRKTLGSKMGIDATIPAGARRKLFERLTG